MRTIGPFRNGWTLVPSRVNVMTAAATLIGVVLVAGALRADFALGIAAVCVAGVLFAAFSGRPRLAFIVWIISLTMIPIWISVDVVVTVPVHCIVAIIALLANFSGSQPQLNPFDLYVATLVLLTLLAVALGDANPAYCAQIIVRWCIPYIAVRVLVTGVGTRFAGNVIAVTLALVGFLALLEFLTDIHPFTSWVSNAQEFDTWHEIQSRGGSNRSEWAFGHSIALGGALSLAIPFIAKSSYRTWVKAAMLLCVSAGVLVTGSRAALLAALLTASICLLYSIRLPIARAFSLAFVALVSFIVGPVFGDRIGAWARGTSIEAAQSAGHRERLYSLLLDRIEWFGRSPGAAHGVGDQASTDSAILVVGVAFGWVVLALVLFPLLVSTIRVFTSRASAAEIALVGQWPLFATVALITQYESLVFVVVGLAVQAVTSQTATSSARSRPTGTIGGPLSPSALD